MSDAAERFKGWIARWMHAATRDALDAGERDVLSDFTPSIVPRGRATQPGADPKRTIALQPVPAFKRG